MYALAVSGSPRRGGNTELLLKEVLTELKGTGWKTELVRVGGQESVVVLPVKSALKKRIMNAQSKRINSTTSFQKC